VRQLVLGKAELRTPRPDLSAQPLSGICGHCLDTRPRGGNARQTISSTGFVRQTISSTVCMPLLEFLSKLARSF
jgi:hypothetical protein